MEEKIVDARGQLCPKPLIMTKQALKQAAPGQIIRVLIDNETSRKNVERFLVDNGITPNITDNKGFFTLTINGTPSTLVRPDAESYCAPESSNVNKPHVIVIKNDKMGTGPDELGSILVKAFVNTIKEVSPLPGAIVFYTNGVLLTVEDSPVIDSLKELETLGVKILVCGTCADYFQIKTKIKVGIISNMYTILETITAANHSIEP